MKKKYYDYFSTPFYIYLIILFLIIGMLVISLFLKETGKAFIIITGINCSSLASLIVGMFVDFGNTKRSLQKDAFEFSVLTEDLNSQCIALMEKASVCAQSKVLINESHGFIEWLEILFSFDNALSKEDNILLINEFLIYLQNVKNSADKLDENLKHFVNNKNVTHEFKFSVERISFYCNAIRQSIISNHYEWAETTTKDNLVESIRYLFPETKEYIENSYSALSLAFNKFSKVVTRH